MRYEQRSKAMTLPVGTSFFMPHYSTLGGKTSQYGWPDLIYADFYVVYGNGQAWRFPMSECVLWSDEFKVPMLGREHRRDILILDDDEAKRALVEYKTVARRIKADSR